MKKYPKINSLYKRDMNGTKQILIGDYSENEIELLKDIKWECTEKIDGTNTSIVWDGYNIQFHGKTENSNIPTDLLKKLQELFTVEKLNNVFPIKKDEDGNDTPMEIILFGEGYGKKIQNGDNYISNDVDFILFDVFISGWWLLREVIEDIAYKLDIKIVPIIGYFTIEEAENLVSKGFR